MRYSITNKIIIGFLVLFHLIMMFYTHHIESSFYTITLIVYILTNILYLTNKTKSGKSIFCFEILFAISFFSSCFLIYIIDISSVYTLHYYLIPEDIKYKFFNISMLGYYCYMFGLIPHKTNESHINKNISYTNALLSPISNILTSFLIIYFFLNNGYTIIYRYSETNETNFRDYESIISYLTILYTISAMAVVSDIKNSQKSTFNIFHFFLNSCIILSIFLFAGYRSQFLQLFLPLTFLYMSYIKTISNKNILLLLILGFIIMAFVGIYRGGGENQYSGNIAYFFRDFTMEGVAGLWLIDYTDHHGITGGSNVILQIVAFIPFLGGFIKNTFVDTHFAESSSMTYTLAFTDGSWGLGTNMIGDLYYTFGIFGVIICMYLVGVLIKKTSNYNSTYSLLCYLLLIGNSIFWTRVEFFYIVRTLGFSFIILFILLTLSSNHKAKHNLSINR